ncbi:hypothetical protein BU24DRAFT_419808, partial [Aaosphaeria arxii CBS 175.79]
MMSEILQRFIKPPVQILSTLQPTQSTALYTVSTRPTPKTIDAKIAHYASLLLKVLFAAVALAAVFTKWRKGSDKYMSLQLRVLEEMLVIQSLIDIQWRYLLPGVLAVLWLALRRGYTEESLLVLHGLGLQTSTSSSTYLQAATQRFIPTTSIQDIFIHEAFKGFEVRYYLAVVIKGEGEVLIVFPTLLPRLAILEEVWRGARACLYEDGTQKAM